MTYQNFLDSQTQPEIPTGLPPLLEALWYAGRDEWDKAHTIAQQHENTPLFDWLHAFLHRQQGDAGNAAYWYSRAGRPEFDGSLRHEWQKMVKTQLPD